MVKGLGLGGAERLLVDQACAAGPGMTYSVAYVRPDKTHFVDQLRQAGVQVIALSGTGRPWPIALARLLRSARPDVVHAHSPLVAAVSRLLVRAGLAGRGAVAAYTEHNQWLAYRGPTRLVNAATMPLDAIGWAVSEEARGSIRPAWLRKRQATLHHGIDLAATRTVALAEPDPPPRPTEAGAFTFVHVANRRVEKAHEVLLDAFALAAAEDDGLRLWLVGQRLDEAVLAAVLARHPARDRIEVLGYRSDAPSLVARSDALVLSSDHEGLPVAVMEAFALGRPVVSTNVGGMPEAVTDGVEGVLVAPRDPAALAAAMVALHRDPERYALLAAGAAAAADRFDASRAQEVQEQAYRRLAGR
ncbi:glycosyltransferase [soil metagenome]